MIPKTSVGLLIITHDPDKGLIALLQRRGHFDFEHMKPESWRGIAQVTVHGDLHKQETFKAGLLREVGEELGLYAKKMVARNFSKAHELARKQTPEHFSITFLLTLPPTILTMIKLHRSSGGLVILRKKDLKKIKPAQLEHKNAGIFGANEFVMFPDEKIALERAFALN